MAKVVILLEDEHDLVELVADLLAESGYVVINLQSVVDLLREARLNSPCLALVDGTSSSVFDLWWVGPHLSALGVPPVAFTAHGSAVEEFTSDPHGYAGVISKPFDADEFVSIVENICWDDHQSAAS